MRILRRLPASLALVMLLPGAPVAEAFAIGQRVITYQDPARGNRSIPIDLFYPADVAGSNVPVAAPPPGGFPVVAFGHGFTIGSNLYGFVESLAGEGFLVALPATETSLLPNHSEFGEDLAFLVNRLKSEGADPASFLYGAVGARGAVGGHSMGGGASFLGAAGDLGIDAVFGFASANTNPSAIAAGASVSVPTLLIAAPNDCVAPPASHQIPMYEASISTCKAYVAIAGASHCQFNDYSLTCDLGEFCSASISRGTQHALVLALLAPWLHAVLETAPFAWDEFQATLAGNASYAAVQSCPDAPVPACSNGADDDGDGLADFPSDPGCDSAGDLSERSPAFACDNGLDDDGDGLGDFPSDPGCFEPIAALESPQCDDDLDNDGDGAVDWDGGPTAAPVDPQCTDKPFKNREARTSGCGLGAELALLGAALAARRRRVR